MPLRILLSTMFLVCLLCTAAPANDQTAMPEIRDALCRLLTSDDIHATMAEMGPVDNAQTMEEVFRHTTWIVELESFNLIYDIVQEVGDNGEVFSEDYIIEIGVFDPSKPPIFQNIEQARQASLEFGPITLDSTDQIEITAEPYEGEEYMAPLWWRWRVFCGESDWAEDGVPGDCRMVRFFWNGETADHNAIFCQ